MLTNSDLFGAALDACIQAHTEHLPTELLIQIFGHLDLKELVGCSRVCRRWRATAFTHETFSRHIEISSDAPAAVHMLQTRLQVSTYSDITLFVRAYGNRTNHGLVSTILEAVSIYLPRLKFLDLSFDARHANDVFTALSGPAPMLESLRLFFSMRGVDTCRIPEDFLGGSAPKLRTFEATPMRLPAAPPPALATVTDVCWQDGHILFSPEELAMCFPSLHTLRLFCSSYVLQGKVEPLRLIRLDNLVLNAEEGAQDLIATFPDDILRDMSYISMTMPTPASVDQLMSHVGGDIRLRLTGEGTTANMFNADLVDMHSGIVRRFGESEVYYHPAVNAPRLSLLAQRGWLARTVEFTLAMSIWRDPRFNQHIPVTLRSCKQFTIVLDTTDEREDAVALRVKPSMPALENVTLSTPYELRRMEYEHLVKLLYVDLKIGAKPSVSVCEGVLLHSFDPEYPPKLHHLPRPAAFH